MRGLVLPIIAAVMLSFATFHVLTAQKPVVETDPPASPPQVDFRDSIAAAGLVEPPTENISIGPHVAGVVQRVHVREGDTVKTGQPLFELDSRHILSEIAIRKAELAAAQAQLKRLQSMPRKEELPASTARVREAKAKLAEQRDSYKRKGELYRKKVISDEEWIAAQQAFSAMEAHLEVAEAEDRLLHAGAWDEDKLVSEAEVKKAEMHVAQVQIELDRHRVLTPEARGAVEPVTEFEVLQVNVRPGERVEVAGTQSMITLGAVGDRHVRVDIDEHDIPRFRPNLPAVGFIRGKQSDRFALRFVRVKPFVMPKKSLTGDNAERVDTRVLQAIYALPKGTPVYIGQQMDVFIRLSSEP